MSAPPDAAILKHLAYNVFLPPQLPQEEQRDSFQQSVDLAIVGSVIRAGQQYRIHMEDGSEWTPIGRMLQRLCNYIEVPLEKERLSEDIRSMRQGDVLSLYIRAQNAGLIVRKKVDFTTFEVFEVQAQTQDVMSTPGRIVRHFPGPAVQVPNSVADDRDFIAEIANILEQMNTEIFDEAYPKSRKAGTDVRETRNSINPNYFIQFFFGYLRGMGTTFDPSRVAKRLGDEVLWMDAKNPWRRSPIWLIVRVALQTSLGSAAYKQFTVYHHASILSECCKDESFSSDLLYTMRVKIAKRLYKLKDSAPQFLIDAVKTTTDEAQGVLQGRWGSVQSTQAQSPNRDFSLVDFDSAIHQTLPNSHGYLQQVFQRRSGHVSPSKFTPTHSPRLENIIVEFSRYANDGLSQAFTRDPHLALFDFEASVFDNLASWTAKQFDYAGACAIIHSCFRQYLTAAKSYYIADVADQSIMMLTLVRIWMAIDQLATEGCPLLSEFSPELPDDILDPLLLRTTQHLEQARIIQEYIRRRYAGASTSNPAIFSNQVTSTSFAVQYFRSSWGQQQTKASIEKNAQEIKQRKIEEMEDLNAKYERLTNELQSKACEYEYKQNVRGKHSPRCGRCQAEKTRNTLYIHPYEWPLPPQQLDAEVVVFELERPAAFVVWRDITYEILADLGASSLRGKCQHYTTLEGYNPLTKWYSSPGSITPRITIASMTKSFNQSHYGRTVSIPTYESQVCLDNALQFSLYDKNGEAWASGPFTAVTFAQYATLKLPPTTLYRHLEYAIEGTTHSSDRVLADQYDCPKELSLHEHIAFGTLRSGARLQWMNIVRGLEEDLLTFSSDEVRLLHTQAAWQVGPLLGDGCREWHQELDSSEFGKLLVSQCKRLLDRVKANWLQATAVSTIVILVTRLLASSPTEEVVKLACYFLRKARDVTHKWLAQLKLNLHHATDEKDIIGFQRICEMAIICRATYDVEPQHIDRLLSNFDDFIPLIDSSVSLYDNEASDLRGAPISLQILLCRSCRFAHKVMPYVLASIRLHDILSQPLAKIWPDYRPGPGGWQVYRAPNNRWATITTARTSEDRSQEVHLNLLTGQLLIDGKPLGRLPRQYAEHPTYLRLFGQKILDVVPAKSPGMEFATRDRIHGYQVSFALEKSSNRLIIQAKIGSNIYELVPHEKLSDDLPLFFSEDYHHWADIKNEVVEFRPISNPWSTDKRQWFLRFNRSRKTTLGDTAGAISLVDIHSPAFKSLSLSIQPLESDRYLHVTCSVDDIVSLELPRMKLSFFVNQDDQLESRNFREQVLDENQSAGTLFGLQNQLVLRAKGSVAQSLPRSRSVLIPDGPVGFETSGHHVSVSIRVGSHRSLGVHRYKIDEDLGQLSTEAGLTSRLFKIYLHALTSHCLPDPLTGRTGTEEALDELSQASSSSFEQIDVKQAELLKAIGLLTPKREYYPAHHRCMQTTHWINLPFLSQHFAFSFAAAAVLHRADTLQLFHPLDFKIPEYISALWTSDALLRRTIQQTAVYYPPDTTGYIRQIMNSTTITDNISPGRDTLTGEWEAAGQAARWASGLAHKNWEKPVYKPYNLVSLAETWRTLDLRSSWITFYNLLRHAKTSSNKYVLSACFASLAFGQAVPMDLIPVLLAFATNPEFASLAPPTQNHFNFEDGYEPSRQRVERKQIYHNIHSPTYQSQFLESIMSQWYRIRQQPSLQLRSTDPVFSKWINTQIVINATRQYISSCAWNSKMKDHLQQLEGVISRYVSAETTFGWVDQRPLPPPIASTRPVNPWDDLSISNLMKTRLAPATTNIFVFPTFWDSKTLRTAADTTQLANLFAELQESLLPLNKQYGQDLDKSRVELASKPSISFPRQIPRSTLVDEIRERCSCRLTKTFQLLSSVLSPHADAEAMVAASGVWPRITPRSLLQQLSLRNRAHFDFLPDWRKGCVGYAQIFADYQRSQRLVALAESGNVEEFYMELDLASDTSPDVDDPDWLLVQIDGNFGARAVQCQVAREMISPSSESNTVLQLNMGEGKSSVIVPIIASSLADSSRLVRVVVLKPLWRQMFDLLVGRLSGLSNRRIYYLPFARNLNINTLGAVKLRNLYEECMREGDILLAQPEHILSFKLMGIDRLISSSGTNDTAVANILRDMQSWLKTHSRDVLDESDEILHVRYQLVYTTGEQKPLDDHPDRWTSTQQLLRLAATHVKRLHQEHTDSVLYKHIGGGQFPTLRIMPDCAPEVEKKLITAIAADVRDGRLLNLNCDCLRPSVRDHLLEFFTHDDLPYPLYESMRRNCNPTISKGLLLVRGFLASGILTFALKRKHYRVDYGLDLGRSLLAVPYRAKDLPSLRVEFGHPDVAVVLTCFSYYYKGLTNEQLDLCFELLYKLDNPSLEYEQWVNRNEATPDDLRQLNSVNIKDRQQFKERLVPTFFRNSATVDFFLSSVVFPKEAKEFTKKLATSGWDLAERANHYTTGFSGTNDNRYLLPTSITQTDPVGQLSTNALVLTYLLQPENNHYICIRDNGGQNLTTEAFLKLLVTQEPEIRVLLDVGAQMLEMQNEQLVRCWLGLRPDIEGAVYFNDRDELVVLPQNGTPALFNTSPFAQRLDKCIVYLDDGHTRGTDLKLPQYTRALVTLGPKVTKDRLLQGCMRMRKLGHGQSVMFAAPPEIDTQIRNASPTSIIPHAKIDVFDVLRWAMLETCKDLQHHVSHWAQQGIEYDRRQEVGRQYENCGDVSILAKGWTTPESRPLENMYGVLSPEAKQNKESFTQRAFGVPDLCRGLELLGIKRLEDPSMDEEQEREVNHEAEREQQTQRPPKGRPSAHSIHPDVKWFIDTGTMPPRRSGIVPLFHPFRASNPEISESCSLLFASADFLHTISGLPIGHLSDYLRPVNWIVSGVAGLRVVLSPHEVNGLLPLIRSSSVVRLHVYAPRVSLAMLSFSDLRFYSIPTPRSVPAQIGNLPASQLQLDLFAGQLYFSSYQDYTTLCATLGLYISLTDEDPSIEIDSDGFVNPQQRRRLINRHPEYSNCAFASTPIPALKDLIGRRRKGMKYLLTHTGKVLHARRMTPEDF